MSNPALFGPQKQLVELPAASVLPEQLRNLKPGSRIIVLGGAASGKTTMLRAAIRELELQGVNPDEIEVLTPSRLSARTLGSQIAIDSELPASRSRARSVSALAFEYIRAADKDIGLLSGANQELVLAQILHEKIRAGISKSWGFDSLTLELKGFRAELRDLVSVFLENQLDQKSLTKLQADFPKIKLAVLHDVLPDYLKILEERGLVDPSLLLIRGTALIGKTQIAAKYLFIDDAQDFSTAGLKFIRELSKDKTLVVFGDPDLATLGFRSAGADQFLQVLAAETRIYISDRTYLPADISKLGATLSGKLPTSMAGPQRQGYSNSSIAQGDVIAMQFPDRSSEADHLALRLRKARLEKGLDWEQMAVIARTRVQLEQIASDLASRNVPTKILGVQKPLRESWAAGAILNIAKAANNSQNSELVLSLLQSDFCGLDSIGVRRLGRQLATLEQFSQLTFSDTLQEILESEIEYDSPEVRKLNSLISLIAKARLALEKTAHELVSLIWEHGPQKRWESLSRGASEPALAANRDIDSVLELFAAAIRFDLNQQGNALDFIEHQLNLAIPEDSLAQIGRRPAVTLATAAQLSGSSFELVALPRLQEGIWPNLKARNSLLGAASLSAYLAGKVQTPLESPKTELADELRMLLKSIGSSRSILWLSCISDLEETPSQFFPLLTIEPEANQDAVDFDLRRKVGRLRRDLLAGDNSAAPVLAALALAGAPGAHPHNWQGLQEISSSEPITEAGEQIRISASKLEAFEKCPLHWFASTFGADSSGFEASLGTLIHAALEMAQSPSDLAGYVESNWHTLQFETDWLAQAQKRKAMNMVALVAQYLGEAGRLVAAEQGFELEVGKLLISGKIDRVEELEDGSVIAVDLKTGRIPTAQEAAENRQVALYQLALSKMNPEAKAVTGRLVYVGAEKLKVMEQSILEGERLAGLETLMKKVELGAGGNTFEAYLDEHCAENATCKLLIGRVVTGG
ncbi:MAG: PD-(D/E)XK nuclease family protein [Aquiluna sp.]|nr:PD-(D/E)XK nuclease family protein [Aquiluna sp.]MCF8546096.1 PD-(D/E)XK nuclease family protein [Aquiluna sp.]